MVGLRFFFIMTFQTVKGLGRWSNEKLLILAIVMLFCVGTYFHTTDVFCVDPERTKHRFIEFALGYTGVITIWIDQMMTKKAFYENYKVLNAALVAFVCIDRSGEICPLQLTQPFFLRR